MSQLKFTVYSFLGTSALCVALSAGCLHHMKQDHDSTSQPRRDINAVLAAHDKDLLATPGVVGVYVGVLADQRTPCLKVMLARNDAASKKKVPHTLEGYPVLIEITGEIQPMK